LSEVYAMVARYYNAPDLIREVYSNFRDILLK
jgi:hypothetical protein